MTRTRTARRRGVAAVETAVVLTFILVPLMIGIWEMGRLVQVQQIVANSAREGARLAAQAKTINSTGSPTQVSASITPATNLAGTPPSPQPNVKAAVVQTLVGAGLNKLTWDDVDVQFKFNPLPSGSSQPALKSPVGGATDPYQGVKNQPFEVTVTLNTAAYDKCKWIKFGLVNPSKVTFTARWQCLVDDPFEAPQYNPDINARW
jgi:Flp pilus assembly protein TadG